MGVELRQGWGLGWGRTLSGGGGSLSVGQGPGSGPPQPEKAWGQSLGRVTFKHGVGPLLRTCTDGERQDVQRGSSGVWSSRVWR